MMNDCEFKGDLTHIFDCGDEIEGLLQQADVFHFHKINEEFQIEVPLAKNKRTRIFNVKDYIKGKKLVYHVHGHPYERQQTKDAAAQYDGRGWPVLASTPDLVGIFAPFLKTQYFPNCVPINDVRYLPRAVETPIMLANGERRFIIGQTPTDVVLKDCKMIYELIAKLGKRWPIIYLKISGVAHDMALRHKRTCNIVFDHAQGYYGLSSLEALSMGKPTLAGLSQETMKAICDFFGITGNQLPWMITKDEQQLEYAILDLINNGDWMHECGANSRTFMETIWSDKNVAQRLAKVYESL